MKNTRIRIFLGIAAFVCANCFAAVAAAQTETLRIVNYNIEDDIDTFTGTAGVPRPGLVQPATSGGAYTGNNTQGGVLEGIGEMPLGSSNNIQPIDILALEETTANTTTVDPIVAGLNAYYGSAGMYARSTVQGTESGGDTADGNGPSALIYNTHSVQLVASLGIGTPHGSSNGEYRQVMRYEFAPAGQTATASNEFYVYVSHYKAGDTDADATSRNQEAQIIRTNSASLPSNARILYVGDYNINTSGDSSYQTIIGSGTNQGIDPLNPSGSNSIDWTQNSLLSAKSESDTSLSVRDDLQIMTSNVYNDTAGGLSLVANSFESFGNNGTTPYHSSTNISGNTSLNGVVDDGGTFLSASSLKNDLTWASDHLPVVADYTVPVPVPEPSTFVLLALGGAFLAVRGKKALGKRAS